MSVPVVSGVRNLNVRLLAPSLVRMILRLAFLNAIVVVPLSVPSCGSKLASTLTQPSPYSYPSRQAGPSQLWKLCIGLERIVDPTFDIVAWHRRIIRMRSTPPALTMVADLTFAFVAPLTPRLTDESDWCGPATTRSEYSAEDSGASS